LWALPLRFIVGYGFMQHGFAKLARGPEGLTGILHPLHMPAAPLLAWATILTELIGGFAVPIGAALVLGGSGPFCPRFNPAAQKGRPAARCDGTDRLTSDLPSTNPKNWRSSCCCEISLEPWLGVPE
jgi:hypothetical protein